jgi:hypothetical protein
VSEFPLPSLRQFLLPDQTVKLRIFTAPDSVQLEQTINEWVQATQAIIAVVGSVVKTSDEVSLALTYVPAVEEGNHGSS